MTARISIYDSAGIDSLRRGLGLDPHRVHRVRTMMFKKFAGYEAALGELPVAMRVAFAEQVDFHPLQLEARLDSEQDGATKLIFATRSGKRIESVLLRAGTGRTALCISSQVGCAANCDFCATGKMGFHSDLTAGEMLDQVVQANEQIRDEGRVVRNIVLMGMGEPYHNELSVYEALDTLVDGRGFNHPASRILPFDCWHPRRHASLRAALSGGQHRTKSPLGAAGGPGADYSASPKIPTWRAAASNCRTQPHSIIDRHD